MSGDISPETSRGVAAADAEQANSVASMRRARLDLMLYGPWVLGVAD
jgi:hypothetical protein